MRSRWIGLGLASLTCGAALAEGVVISGAGTDGEVTTVMNEYRALLGALNPNAPGSFGSGRREINWDAVPDGSSSPNAFPGGFFNGATTGRARGVVFSTPGSGFEVSADSDNPTATAPDFAHLNPQYGDLFRAFSPQRLFTATGSTITDVRFFIPGEPTPATVSGFGAVFSDVNELGSTYIEYYDAADALLATAVAPVGATENEGASFVGVFFNAGESVSRVRIVSGEVVLGAEGLEGALPGGGFADAVVMDDFVYGEPVPEPASVSLLGLGAAAWLRRRR
ncbi:MAG: PEP-CTERM sorting domain-containing protein [Phycisphaerales bacterium]|nr:PEP-CTERM sorting domain-containing protein [Phycisphaerales bacterium]